MLHIVPQRRSHGGRRDVRATSPEQSPQKKVTKLSPKKNGTGKQKRRGGKGAKKSIMQESDDEQGESSECIAHQLSVNKTAIRFFEIIT